MKNFKTIISNLLIIGFCATIVACDGSGGGNSTNSVAGPSGSSGNTPSSPGGGSPKVPQGKSYNITYPQGSQTIATLEVDPQTQDIVKVDLPNGIVKLNIQAIKHDPQFAGDINSMCQQVQEESQVFYGRAPQDIKDHFWNGVINSVHSSWSMPKFDKAFEDYATTTINAQYGTKYNHLNITNGIFENAAFTIKFTTPNAMSLGIDSDAANGHLISISKMTVGNDLLQLAKSGSSSDNSNNMAFPVDLFCDLYQGNANLTLSFNGHYSTPQDGTILSPQELKSVDDDMVNFFKQYGYPKNNTAAQNVTLSAIKLKQILKAHNKELDVKDFPKVFKLVAYQNIPNDGTDIEDPQKNGHLQGLYDVEINHGVYNLSDTPIQVNAPLNVSVSVKN